MGRRPKPTHLKLVTGTLRSSRAARTESRPATSRPRLPSHLDGEARIAWLEFAPLLEGMGVLTAQDAAALERLAHGVALVRTLERTLADNRLTYSAPVLNKRGEPLTDAEGRGLPGMLRMRPEVAALADADRRLRGWLAEFGLTPAARSKVKALDPYRDATPPGGVDYFGPSSA